MKTAVFRRTIMLVIRRSIFLLGCLFFCLSELCKALPSTIYMMDYCLVGKNIVVNTSVILHLTNNFPDHTDAEFAHCDSDILTSADKRIMVHFISVDITDAEHTPDRLHISDYGIHGLPVRLTPTKGVFGVYENHLGMEPNGIKDYKSTENKMRLNYLGKPSADYNGFKLLVTAFQDTKNFKCRKGFHCVIEEICIPHSLRCDGQANCGMDDSSDEKGCGNDDDYWGEHSTATTAILVGGLASGIFLFAAIIIGVIVYRYSQTTYPPRTRVVSRREPLGMNSSSNAELYAPPSYEDVVGAVEEEDPPPEYHVVTSTNQNSRKYSNRYSRKNPNNGNNEKSACTVHCDNEDLKPEYENISIPNSKSGSSTEEFQKFSDEHAHSGSSPDVTSADQTDSSFIPITPNNWESGVDMREDEIGAEVLDDQSRPSSIHSLPEAKRSSP